MKPVTISTTASKSIQSASTYYSKQDRRLASAFLKEFDSVCSLASESPNIGSPVGNGNRKLVMKRFPFIVIYRNEPDRVFVLAVGHQHRHPDNWLNDK